MSLNHPDVSELCVRNKVYHFSEDFGKSSSNGLFRNLFIPAFEMPVGPDESERTGRTIHCFGIGVRLLLEPYTRSTLTAEHNNRAAAYRLVICLDYQHNKAFVPLTADSVFDAQGTPADNSIVSHYQVGNYGRLRVLYDRTFNFDKFYDASAIAPGIDLWQQTKTIEFFIPLGVDVHYDDSGLSTPSHILDYVLTAYIVSAKNLFHGHCNIFSVYSD